ncbi:hypothetical protein WN51_01791 [Melipona quadrifasciata]|uniref:Retrotransposon gag domain-containing protein n=1 Tax=Melipona quadrifasciata TaxID=166423 RepID=A0A0M8ZXM1_9HYME|nr:hypothetical protein WN51_01791 [Melipona quadrifasciata]
MQNIRQGNNETVQSYANRFKQALQTNPIARNLALEQERTEAIKFFVYNLRPELAYCTLPMRPSTLLEAQQYAIDTDVWIQETAMRNGLTVIATTLMLKPIGHKKILTEIILRDSHFTKLTEQMANQSRELKHAINNEILDQNLLILEILITELANKIDDFYYMIILGKRGIIDTKLINIGTFIESYNRLMQRASITVNNQMKFQEIIDVSRLNTATRETIRFIAPLLENEYVLNEENNYIPVNYEYVNRYCRESPVGKICKRTQPTIHTETYDPTNDCKTVMFNIVNLTFIPLQNDNGYLTIPQNPIIIRLKRFASPLGISKLLSQATRPCDDHTINELELIRINNDQLEQPRYLTEATSSARSTEIGPPKIVRFGTKLSLRVSDRNNNNRCARHNSCEIVRVAALRPIHTLKHALTPKFHDARCDVLGIGESASEASITDAGLRLLALDTCKGRKRFEVVRKRKRKLRFVLESLLRLIINGANGSKLLILQTLVVTTPARLTQHHPSQWGSAHSTCLTSKIGDQGSRNLLKQIGTNPVEKLPIRPKIRDWRIRRSGEDSECLADESVGPVDSLGIPSTPWRCSTLVEQGDAELRAGFTG